VRPDGSISFELHRGIARTLRQLPNLPVADAHDVARVDFERSVRRHLALAGGGSRGAGARSAGASPGGGLWGGSSVATDGTRLLALPEPPSSGLMSRLAAEERAALEARRTRKRLGKRLGKSNNRNSNGSGSSSHHHSNSGGGSSSSSSSGVASGSRGMGQHAAAVLGDASGFGAGRPGGNRPGGNRPEEARGCEARSLGALPEEWGPAGSSSSRGSSRSSSASRSATDAAALPDGAAMPNAEAVGAAAEAAAAVAKGRRRGGKKPAQAQQVPSAAARRKKPFSSSSLLDCLLDLEYGPTDAKATRRAPATGGDAGWDTAAFL
jgi:hypothetical protein